MEAFGDVDLFSGLEVLQGSENSTGGDAKPVGTSLIFTALRWK